MVLFFLSDSLIKVISNIKYKIHTNKKVKKWDHIIPNTLDVPIEEITKKDFFEGFNVGDELYIWTWNKDDYHIDIGSKSGYSFFYLNKEWVDNIWEDPYSVYIKVSEVNSNYIKLTLRKVLRKNEKKQFRKKIRKEILSTSIDSNMWFECQLDMEIDKINDKLEFEYFKNRNGKLWRFNLNQFIKTHFREYTYSHENLFSLKLNGEHIQHEFSNTLIILLIGLYVKGYILRVELIEKEKMDIGYYYEFKVTPTKY